MTYEELQYRQSWTLEQKIDHAVGAIQVFINRMKEEGKGVYVSFSGGKDSTVLLDICRRFVDPEIKAVFCNTGNEYPEIVRFVKTVPNVETIFPEMTIKQVFAKCGFPLISKEQAMYIRECRTTKSEKVRDLRLNGRPGKDRYKISNKWRFLVYTNFCVSEKCCEILKKKPFKEYEGRTGAAPIIGTMTDESLLRMNQYIKRGGCNTLSERPASYPISIFLDSDIWDYIRRFNISYCPIYDIPEVNSTGCRLCGFGLHLETGYGRVDILFDHSPKFYQVAMSYTNNGVTFREALRCVGVSLPDENRQLKLAL